LDVEHWRKITNTENGWVDIASFKRLELIFEYKWHCDYKPNKRKNKGIQFDPILSDPGKVGTMKPKFL